MARPRGSGEDRGCAVLVVPPEALPDYDLVAPPHRVAARMVLDWGAEDRIVPPSYDKRFADMLSTAIVVPLIAGAAHLVVLDTPAAIAAIVRNDSG